MALIRRSAKKGAKAYVTAKGAKKAAKAAKKGAKGWAVYRVAKKAAPTRLLVALGGVAAAALAATAAKRRGAADDGATTGEPAHATTVKHEPAPAKDDGATAPATGVNEGTPPRAATGAEAS